MSNQLVVVGLGYVGMPLAQKAVRSGLKVTGLDVVTGTVSSLNAGSSHIDDLSDADVVEMLDGGFTATTDTEALSAADTIAICVPTPLRDDTTPRHRRSSIRHDRLRLEVGNAGCARIDDLSGHN